MSIKSRVDRLEAQDAQAQPALTDTQRAQRLRPWLDIVENRPEVVAAIKRNAQQWPDDRDTQRQARIVELLENAAARRAIAQEAGL